MALFGLIHQLPLLRVEFRIPKLTLHSDLRRRAISRRALPCPSSCTYLCAPTLIARNDAICVNCCYCCRGPTMSPSSLCPAFNSSLSMSVCRRRCSSTSPHASRLALRPSFGHCRRSLPARLVCRDCRLLRRVQRPAGSTVDFKRSSHSHWRRQHPSRAC